MVAADQTIDLLYRMVIFKHEKDNFLSFFNHCHYYQWLFKYLINKQSRNPYSKSIGCLNYCKYLSYNYSKFYTFKNYYT